MLARDLVRSNFMRHLLYALSLCLLSWSASAQTLAPALRLGELRVSPERLRETVQRDVALRPGDVVDAQQLSQLQEQLQSSGRYRSIQIYTERGSVRGEVVLIVEAELDRRAHLLTGFGHAPLSGWYLDLLGVRWNNPLHRGDELRFGYRTGQRIAGLHGEYMGPKVLGPLDLHLELNGLSERWRIHEGESVYNQRIERGEFLLGLGWVRPSGFGTTFWMGGKRAEPDGTIEGIENAEDESSGRLVPVDDGDRFNVLGLDLDFDRRAPGDWRGGHEHFLELRSFDADEGPQFGRAAWSSAVAWPLPANGALALRARAAAVGAGAPYYERLQFGGTDSVRGFRDASLSGPLGARAYWLSNLEWRAPILPRVGRDPRIVGVLFADVGQHWNADNAPQDLALGVGYGLRVRVPWIQIFSLDVGIPLTDDTTDDAFWAHASLGFGF